MKTHLNFAFFPDVPFLRVLNYLSGPQIEKCRGISRLFRQRIDINRKLLPSVQLDSLTLEHIRSNDIPAIDYPAIYHNEIEPVSLIRIWKGCLRIEGPSVEIERAPVKKALERFEQLLPRMSFKSFQLYLRDCDEFTFRQWLEKFKDLNIKCQNFAVNTRDPAAFQWDDLRPMLLRLKPKNLYFEIWSESSLFTSSFWQEKFLRDCSQLCVRGSNGFFDDQVLLNLTQSGACIMFVTACTVDGIVSFLKEWKAGNREVTDINLIVRATGLDPKAFFAMLPWNVEIVIREHGTHSTYIVNSLGKKIELAIYDRKDGSFGFYMVDEDVVAKGSRAWLDGIWWW